MKLAETVYKMGRVGSSELIEFLIAALVGFLAVLGALFCIGFLLVDPVRNPMGEGEVSQLSKFARVCVRQVHWNACSAWANFCVVSNKININSVFSSSPARHFFTFDVPRCGINQMSQVRLITPILCNLVL